MASPDTSAPCKLVILVSGGGSNLQSFIDGVENGSLSAEIAAVFSNRPKAFGLERAAKAAIATEVVDHTLFESREAFDAELMQRIDAYSPDLVILAGFMRILTPWFVRQWAGRMINIHPSLLPKYPGLNTHQRAIDAGDSNAGCSVHWVTEGVDEGSVIAQASVPILADDSAETLATRVLAEEHVLYPRATAIAAHEILAKKKPLSV